jgi:hypothetical protein
MQNQQEAVYSSRKQAACHILAGNRTDYEQMCWTADFSPAAEKRI